MGHDLAPRTGTLVSNRGDWNGHNESNWMIGFHRSISISITRVTRARRAGRKCASGKHRYAYV